MSVTTDKNREADTDDELDHAEEKVDDDAAEEVTVDNTADDTPDVELRVRRWPRRVVLGAAIVLFVAALAASGFFGWQLWQQRQIERAGEDAQQAAVTYAQVLTSIDSNKVDENFAQVLDGATGEFKDMYSQSSVQLRQLLVDNKANAHGVVLDSAVQSASEDKVVVLLFVDQSVSNTSVPDPRVDRSRIKMTMENVDGHWRASKVELP